MSDSITFPSRETALIEHLHKRISQLEQKVRELEEIDRIGLDHLSSLERKCDQLTAENSRLKDELAKRDLGKI